MSFLFNADLYDAIFVTALCVPFAVASLALHRFRKPLRATAETKWIAPIVCVLACAMILAVWALYFAGTLDRAP